MQQKKNSKRRINCSFLRDINLKCDSSLKIEALNSSTMNKEIVILFIPRRFRRIYKKMIFQVSSINGIYLKS